MRRQFNSSYESVIGLIKSMKNSNDYLNRNIGIESQTAITAHLRTDQPLIDKVVSDIEKLIQQLQQSYLDPDTARKIGTAKQQFRIQRDRRKQLLQSMNLDDRDAVNPQLKGKLLQNGQTNGMSSDEPKREQSQSTWSRFTHKQNDPSAKSETANIQMQREDDLHHEYELQHRIMQQRSREINDVSRNLLNVHNIINQTAILTHEQGQQLDIIGEQIFTTFKYVREGRQNLTEANEHQRNARRKYVYLSLILLLTIAVGAILILA